MKKGVIPDPDKIFPLSGCSTVTYIKPTVKNPNISVGDFTYFGDTDFESHVTHHYDFNKVKKELSALAAADRMTGGVRI